MILLAVDTATTTCGVAIFQDQSLLADMVHLAGKTHSRQLSVMIETALAHCGLAARDIDRIAVSRGPGTFTGLRIGISTVKGLAMAINAPVIGVSSLAALAFPFSGYGGRVIAMVDARRGEVYYAGYENGVPVRDKGLSEQVGPPENLRPFLSETTLLVGSGAVLYRDLLVGWCSLVRFAQDDMNVIRACAVGRLAMDPNHCQAAVEPGFLLPAYIRPSDAQVSK